MSNNGVFVCFFLNNCHVSIDSILHCYIPNRVSRYLRLVCIWDSVLVLNGGSDKCGCKHYICTCNLDNFSI